MMNQQMLKNEIKKLKSGYGLEKSDNTGGNEEIDKQFINSPENLFNLSPTCPFIPRNFGEK